MSVLNAMKVGDGWYVVVDSAGQAEDGTRCHQQKLFVLPHAQGVLAARGEVGHLPPYLAMKYMTDAQGGDFDGIAQGFAQFVQQCHDEMAEHVGDRREGYEETSQEIVLVGYSAKRADVLCIVALRSAGSPTFDVQERPTGHFSPGYKIDLRNKTVSDPLDYLGMLVEGQIIEEYAHHSNAVIGGRLTVAKVMQHRVVVTNISGT